MIKVFAARTGYPVVVNMSLSVRGEPIAGTPDGAYHGFLFTEMDALVLEDEPCVKDREGGP